MFRPLHPYQYLVLSKRPRLSSSVRTPPVATAAATVGGCDDLVREILLRLPAKSLIRFRFLSRPWRSIISDHKFACHHSRRVENPLTSGLYIIRRFRGHKIYLVSLHGLADLPPLSALDALGTLVARASLYGAEPDRLVVAASCKGLLLCQVYKTTKFVIYNPTNSSFNILPLPDKGELDYPVFYTASLAFDPSKSSHYRVFYLGRTLNYRRKMPLFIDVYSSATACWKRAHVTEDLYWADNPPSPYHGGIFWNGEMHWITMNPDHMRYDLETDELTINSFLPEIPFKEITFFGDCGGHLVLIRSPQPSSLGFTVFQMDSNNFHWSVYFEVNLTPLIAEIPQLEEMKLIDVVEVADEINPQTMTTVLVLVLPAGGVISYNLSSKTFRVIHNLPPEITVVGSFRYIPTIFAYLSDARSAKGCY